MDYRYETIIISKEAYEFMRNLDREKHGFRKLTKEMMENIWIRLSNVAIRNRGASNAMYPINENEIRIDKDVFDFRWDDVKKILINNGFGYRKDGFIVKGFYI